MYKILLILVVAETVFCVNILYVSSILSPSHHIWNRILATELAKKGHNVTLIDPDIDRAPKPTNFTHILMEGIYEKLSENYDINEMTSHSSLNMIYSFQEGSIFNCKNIYQTEGFHRLLNYPPKFKFDLMIVDVTAGSCLYPMIHRFNYPPTIAVTAFLLPSYVSYNFGNHFYPTFIPFYGVPYGTDMTFLERVKNFVFMHFDAALRYFRLYKKEHEMAKKIFGENVPSVEKFEQHMSLVLTNIDPVLDYPHPVVSNFISVGGLHTRNSKQLPQDLQTILDNCQNGVIVFSLGTNVRSDKLDKSTQMALLEAFSKLSETVIWKFESNIDNLPKNVIIRKWLPQNDVLGHSKVKLFIGHGGTLSTQEAIFHGVPMISIPFIVDQHINTRMIVNRKLGTSLDFKQITADYVLETIKEVLEKPEYRENMQKVSKIFKDRMETPLERAVFWTEYVIRNGGAHFLSSPARKFSYLKASGLDIILFLILTSIFVLICCYKLLLLISKLFISKKKMKIN